MSLSNVPLTDSTMKYVFYTLAIPSPYDKHVHGWGVHGLSIKEEGKALAKGLSPTGFDITERGYIDTREKTPQSAVVSFYEKLGFVKVLEKEICSGIVPIIRILESLLEYSSKDDSVLIFTPSERIETFINTHIAKLHEKGIFNAEHGNIPCFKPWRDFNIAYRACLDKGLTFEFVFDPSQISYPGYEMARTMCQLGLQLSIKEGSEIDELFRTYESSDYWSPKIVINPLIHYRRLYFNPAKEVKKGLYHMAYPGKTGVEHMFGKRSNNSKFCVLSLDVPDDIIEMYKDRQAEYSKDLETVMVMRLDKIYTKDFRHLTSAFPDLSIVNQKKPKFGIDFIDGLSVVEDIQPPGLIFRVVDVFTNLEHILADFHTSLSENTTMRNGLIFTDITSLFYDEVQEKNKTSKVLKKDITPTTDVVVHCLEAKEKGKSIEVRIILGSDTPPRNNLKKIEDDDPSVYFVHWFNGDSMVQYAIVLKTRNASGIWSNYFASTYFIS